MRKSTGYWIVMTMVDFAATLAAVAALLLLGCGKQCDFVERGGCFQLNAPIDFTQEDARAILAAADASWGQVIDLRHYEVEFVDDARIPCAGKKDQAVGCTWSHWPGSHMEIARLPPCTLKCVFFHELGHVAEPSAPHEDWRFAPTAEVWAACATPPTVSN